MLWLVVVCLGLLGLGFGTLVVTFHVIAEATMCVLQICFKRSLYLHARTYVSPYFADIGGVWAKMQGVENARNRVFVEAGKCTELEMQGKETQECKEWKECSTCDRYRKYMRVLPMI